MPSAAPALTTRLSPPGYHHPAITTRLFDLADTLFDQHRTAGVLKPDPALYQAARTRLVQGRVETLLVGDNWQADVVGALAVGIRLPWLSRTGAAPAPRGRATRPGAPGRRAAPLLIIAPGLLHQPTP